MTANVVRGTATSSSTTSSSSFNNPSNPSSNSLNNQSGNVDYLAAVRERREDSPSEQSAQAAANKSHKRTYQACEPCRNRKVRCDLGSVDAPGDPPCQRCRREKKHCYFTETRRKRKAGELDGLEYQDYGRDGRRDSGGAGNGPFADGYGGRPEHLDGMGVYTNAPPAVTVGRTGLSSTVIRPEVRVKGDGEEVRNSAAAALFQQPIHQPGDALRLLVDAASNLASKRSETSQPPQLKEEAELSSTTPVDPNAVKLSDSDLSDPARVQQLAIQTWARLRYVRAGWFTPLEGMEYLEYFTINLSNLTAMPLPNFLDHATHIKLLTEEPMLTITLLAIASRYKKLAGAAGASRSIYIHSILWRECQSMVTRMFWGQEHFGGAFGLASGFRADAGESMKRGLRGLGTVEALLILSDWHPRSMHFPPAAGNDDILAPLQSEWEEANSAMSRNPHQGWTEPAMRSDRMSWSLVGAAYNLAVELGVFDSMPEMGHFEPQYKTRAYDSDRADKVGRLVHIYVSQTSGRLGYPNMLPHQGNDMENAFFQMRQQPDEGETDSEYRAEQMQRAWCELTAIMRRVNNEIFRSKQQTLELIQSDKYTKVLESFEPLLKNWLHRAESIELPDETRMIIMMEYEYARTYINSLALQAQIEQYAELANNDPQAATSETKAMFSKKWVEISKKNAPYIAEVVESTRNLLRHVVDGLAPSGGLKHSPVRTIFRILSGAMFLLKTLALGSKESDIQQSVALLNQTVTVLRQTVVDDCHISLRIADLLASLITAISTKFVRVPISSKHGGSKRHRTSMSSKPTAIRLGDTKATESTASHKGEQNYDPQPASAISGGNTSTDMPLGGAPLVNPNDPNISIVPPPDYVYYLGSDHYQRNGSSRTSSSAAANVQNGYAPAYHQGGQSSSPPQQPHSSNSPSMANVTAEGGAIGFSAPSTQPQQQPFSPISNGSSNGTGSNSDDWYAMNINPLLLQSASLGMAGGGGNGGNGGAGGLHHLQQHQHGGADGGAGMGGMVAGMGGVVGGGYGGMPWVNVLGPEIGDSLDVLNTLTADGLPYGEPGFGWNR